jgi:hypothetical protein
MLNAWTQHPIFFVALAVLGLAVLALLAYVYLKNCDLRYKERASAMQAGRPRLLFFSEHLLRYIPWQFWASLMLLLLLAVMFLGCSYSGLSTSASALLELVKYVTGAVIGSLFGKGHGDSTRIAGDPQSTKV